jgi:hypothetical protein
MSRPDPLNAKIIFSPELISQALPLGETLLLHSGTLNYFALDSLGTKLWTELQGDSDPLRAAERVAKATGMAHEEMAKRLTVILQSMERSGLIRLLDDRPGKAKR